MNNKKRFLGILLSCSSVTACCLLLFSCSKANNAKPPLSGNNGTIQGIYFIRHYGYMDSYFSAYLLLKDGSIKKEIITPPELLNENQSRQSDPDNWGKWTQTGDSIRITWNDGTKETWDTWYFGMPADNGETLDGKYTSQFSIENKQYESFNFSPDGKFSLTEKKAGTDQTLTGNYFLNGYDITLKFGDGHTEQWAFNFYCKGYNTVSPQKDKTAFIMAEDNYAGE